MVDIEVPSYYQTIKTRLESIVAKKHYTKTQSDAKYVAQGDAITSIELVQKGSDPTADAYNGVIRVYYGDEQSP